MADQKKPKKDLRARLGRTISPNTPGAGPIPAPGIAPPGGAVPPPAGQAPIQAPPAIQPPGGGAPVMAPPVAAPKLPFGGPDVAPPPFARPAAAPAPSAPPPSNDPFAAGAPQQGPREVRPAFSAADMEVGRKSSGRTAAIVGVSILLGLAIGGGVASMNNSRIYYNKQVRDGHEVYGHVTEAQTRLEEAQRHVDALVTAAAGSATTPPAVAYDEITALRQIENPFPADHFSRNNYMAFSGEIVDLLFHYYQSVLDIWSRIERLAAMTLPDARRAALEAAAPGNALACTAGAADPQPGLDAGAQMLADIGGAQQFGAVVMMAPEGSPVQVIGQLAYVEAGSDGEHVMARGTRSGRGAEMQIFTPGAELSDRPEFVLVIDGAGSRGVLSTQTGPYGDYVNAIRELKTTIDETVEIQGRLISALGEIAALEEVFAIGG